MAKEKSNLKKELAKLQKDWNKAVPREGFATLPDANYIAKIESTRLEKAKESGRLQIAMCFKILEGEHKGKKIFKYDGLANVENFEWFKGTLEKLDVEIPDDIEGIVDILPEIEGKIVDITLRTKNDFQSIYINEIVEREEEDEEEDKEIEEEEEEESDDEEETKDEDEDEDEEKEDEEEDEEDEDEDKDEEEDEDEDEDEDEEEDEEEEEKPRKKKSKAIVISTKQLLAMNIKETKKFIDDHDLDINPKKYSSLAKLKRAIAKLFGLRI